VISLAGVLGLDAAAREKIGKGAATELTGGDPGPLAWVPIPAAVRCIHSRADGRVPGRLSVAYVAAARAAGQDAGLPEVGGDHFSIASTTAPTWPTVIRELEELLGAA
jgi:hypothetical protein